MYFLRKNYIRVKETTHVIRICFYIFNCCTVNNVFSLITQVTKPEKANKGIGFEGNLIPNKTVTIYYLETIY